EERHEAAAVQHRAAQRGELIGRQLALTVRCELLRSELEHLAEGGSCGHGQTTPCWTWDEVDATFIGAPRLQGIGGGTRKRSRTSQQGADELLRTPSS